MYIVHIIPFELLIFVQRRNVVRKFCCVSNHIAMVLIGQQIVNSQKKKYIYIYIFYIQNYIYVVACRYILLFREKKFGKKPNKHVLF